MNEPIPMERPMVSVWMITYNHEKYIRACLDSVVMQKTNFRFEVVIGEDCSTDGTKAIVREFENRFPEIIKPIYQKTNQGAYANSLKFVVPQLSGKYITPLEGDDYWTDPLKLQKQVDAMEADLSLSMVLTDAQKSIDGKLVPFYPGKLPPEKFDLRQFLTDRHLVATCTVMLKRDAVEEAVRALANSDGKIFHMDFFIWCIAGRQGQYRFLDIKTGVYRIHSSSILRSTSRNITLQRGKEMNHFLVDYLGSEYKRHFLAGDWWYHLEFAFLAIQEKQWLRSIAFLLRSLISATRYGQGRQLRIMRDYLYRVRNRRVIN